MENIEDGSKVKAVDISKEFKKYKYWSAKVKYWGREYNVISRLIETQEINKVRYLLVQFHKEHI